MHTNNMINLLNNECMLYQQLPLKPLYSVHDKYATRWGMRKNFSLVYVAAKLRSNCEQSIGKMVKYTPSKIFTGAEL